LFRSKEQPFSAVVRFALPRQAQDSRKSFELLPRQAQDRATEQQLIECMFMLS
jgi:hypothetical protein